MTKRGWQRLFFMMLVLVFSLAILNLASARQSKTFADEVAIDLVRTSPSPIQPGESFDLWFEIRNIYPEDLTNLEITLSTPLPFVKLQSEEYIKKFKTLKQGGKELFKYTIITSKNIENGDYSLSLNYYSERLSETITEEYVVKIKKAGIIISETTVTLEPEDITIQKIAPGKIAQIKINVENSEDYLMKDVSVKLNLSGDIPFAPVKTTTEKEINEILAGKSVDVLFNILALPNAEAGIYKVPIVIKYYDELGDLHIKNDLISVVIGSDPNIYVEIRENEIYNVPGVGDINLNLINAGLTDLKFVKVCLRESITDFSFFGFKLWDTKNYEILSEDCVYIGEIDVDDTESVKFRLKLKTPYQKINLPLIITFMDANNKEYVKERNVEFEIHSKKEMGVASNSYWWWILIIIIVVILFFDYRVWKKHNKECGVLDYIAFIPKRLTGFKRKK